MKLRDYPRLYVGLIHTHAASQQTGSIRCPQLR